MFLRPAIMLLVFILIAPQSRAYLGAHLLSVGAWIHAWAPFSYLLLLVLPVAGFASMNMVKKAPQWVAPENPMAKYRNDIPDED
jgi:hypothetical protein